MYIRPIWCVICGVQSRSVHWFLCAAIGLDMSGLYMPKMVPPNRICSFGISESKGVAAPGESQYCKRVRFGG